MNYNEAVQEWGARRIEASRWRKNLSPIDRSTVKVEFEFNEGYACCGGTDPNCYCSFAESPSANVVITGRTNKHSRAEETATISSYEFDFATILQELVEAGGYKEG